MADVLNGSTANERRFPNGYTCTDTIYKFSDGTWSIGNALWYRNPFSNDPSLISPAGTHSYANSRYYTGIIGTLPPATGQQAFTDIMAPSGMYVKINETEDANSTAPRQVDNNDGTTTMALDYECPMIVLGNYGLPAAPVNLYFKMKCIIIANKYNGTAISVKYYYNGTRSE